MTAPLHALQQAACQFAESIGAKPPTKIILDLPGFDAPLPLPGAEPETLPRKMTRMELVVYQAIRSADEPIVLKDIMTQTRKSKSAVCAALVMLKRRQVIENDGEGYKSIE